jgi:methyltransferase (TIGR00027 family)
VTDAAPQPSRTSQAVAVTRAQFTRPHAPTGDAFAQTRLCEGMVSTVMTDRVPSLRARTRFFDDQVEAAIAAGIGQIVILGAGYDDRALRFRTPGVAFVELDHPATQHDKARRLHALREPGALPTLAPADFAHDDVDSVLEEAGHDATRTSLFVGEGLLAYLDEATIVRLLSTLGDRAHPGSRLALSLATHPAGLDSERVKEVANAQRRTGVSEPWLTILPAAEHLALITRAGWRVERTLDQAELETDAPAGRSLLVAAVRDGT